MNPAERAYSKAIKQLSTLPSFPPREVELMRTLLSDAFEPAPPWERGEERRYATEGRRYARMELKRIIQGKLPIKLP